MNSVVEFAHPQPLAAVVALLLFSVVLPLETVMLWLAARQAARPAERPPVAEEALQPEAYDWLYE